jgi:hypothetical protein
MCLLPWETVLSEKWCKFATQNNVYVFLHIKKNMTENFLYILDLSFSDHDYKRII